MDWFWLVCGVGSIGLEIHTNVLVRFASTNFVLNGSVQDEVGDGGGERSEPGEPNKTRTMSMSKSKHSLMDSSFEEKQSSGAPDTSVYSLDEAICLQVESVCVLVFRLVIDRVLAVLPPPPILTTRYCPCP